MNDELATDVDPESTWRQLAEQVRPTTFISSERIDEAAGGGAKLLLVSETLQHTGSFKFRAALSAALHSDAPHLLTASSGNFGAALAMAATRTGKRCTVVMPSQSAETKIASVRSLGGTVDLIDTDRISRTQRIEELCRDRSATQFVSPYDNWPVIAGNSSLGRELFEREKPDGVIVPIGGGGLASGFLLARDRLAPTCEVIGAEPLLANDAARSLRDGHLYVDERESRTICDGARTRSLGQLNFTILRNGLLEIIEVKESVVVQALRFLFEFANLKVEPTGALSLAALLQNPSKYAGKRIACIISGGNVDPNLYSRLLSQVET